MQSLKRGTKAVFLDRDGTVNEDRGYVYKLADLKFTDRAPQAIHRLKQNNFLVIVITNQSGVARGMFTLAEVENFHQHMQKKLIEQVGSAIDKFFVCPHHPEEGNSLDTCLCECRKPNNKLVLDAIKEFNIDTKKSYFIGDKASDMECAQRSNIIGIQILNPNAQPHPHASHQAKSLFEALPFILGN